MWTGPGSGVPGVSERIEAVHRTTSHLPADVAVGRERTGDEGPLRIVARHQPIGGVGVRSVRNGTAAVRRLWMDQTWRRPGITGAPMATLEGAAGELGLKEVEIGSGHRQPETVALDASIGRRQRAAGAATPTIRLTKTPRQPRLPV